MRAVSSYGSRIVTYKFPHGNLYTTPERLQSTTIGTGQNNEWGPQFMAKGKDLQSGEIGRLLQDLGNELAASGFTTVRVMVVGGAYMLLTIGNRAITQDIDVFPLNFASSAHPDKNTKTILKAIGAVAKRNSLRRDWFNDAAFGIIGELQPPEQQLTLWKTYGALEIYMPPAEFILAVKIFG
jgi:hypothetical protein